MVVADLHVHTTASDGTLAPAAVPAAARAAGVEAVAVTDHDRLQDRPPVADHDGVTVIAGIELRVAADEHLDLLGYATERTDALVAEVERLQRDRIERARTIVARVAEHTGVDVADAVSFDAGVGRPHIARAIADSEAPYDYSGAFESLIGDDGPCYVARDVPDFETGRRLLEEACSLVALAHPLRYDDPAAALALTDRLDAVERFYDYGRPVDPAPIDRVVEAHDLLVTGGSDAHDETLGVAGLDRAAYRAVRDRLPAV